MIDFDSANHIVEGRRGGCIIRSTASATLSMDDENGRLRKAVEAFDVSVEAVTEILAAMCDAALATITRLHEEGKVDPREIALASGGIIVLAMLCCTWCCMCMTDCFDKRTEQSVSASAKHGLPCWRSASSHSQYKKLQIRAGDLHDEELGKSPAHVPNLTGATGRTAASSCDIHPTADLHELKHRPDQHASRRPVTAAVMPPKLTTVRKPQPQSARSSNGGRRSEVAAQSSKCSSSRSPSPQLNVCSPPASARSNKSSNHSPPASARSNKSSSCSPPASARSNNNALLFNRILNIPGPGTYEIDTESLAQRSARSHNSLASVGSSRFLTGERRRGVEFQVLNAGLPGPGHYEREGLALRLQTHNTSGKKGNMRFDSRSPRNVYDYANKPLSQVHSYDYSHLYGCGEAQAGPQMSSSFLSALPMFGHVQRSTTPPVTRYSPEKPDKRDKGLSKEGSSCFAGSSPQHTSQCAGLFTTSERVGPGTYFTGQESLEQRMKDAKSRQKVIVGFGSSEPRSDPTNWC